MIEWIKSLNSIVYFLMILEFYWSWNHKNSKILQYNHSKSTGGHHYAKNIWIYRKRSPSQR